MARIDYDSIIFQQDGWINSGMSQKRKDDLIALSNKLMHKAIDNNHELDNLSLLYPEDCDDYDAFTDLAYAFNALVSIRKGGGCKMEEFGKHRRELRVE